MRHTATSGRLTHCASQEHPGARRVPSASKMVSNGSAGSSTFPRSSPRPCPLRPNRVAEVPSLPGWTGRTSRSSRSTRPARGPRPGLTSSGARRLPGLVRHRRRRRVRAARRRDRPEAHRRGETIYAPTAACRCTRPCCRRVRRACSPASTGRPLVWTLDLDADGRDRSAPTCAGRCVRSRRAARLRRRAGGASTPAPPTARSPLLPRSAGSGWRSSASAAASALPHARAGGRAARRRLPAGLPACRCRPRTGTRRSPC